MPTRKLGAVIAALSIGVLAALAVPTAASAHTGTLSASAVCQADGTRVVTYTGSTTSVPDSGSGHVATLTVGEIAPSGSTVSPSTQQVTGDATYTFTQTVPGTAKSASATAFLVWGDGVKSDPIGTLNFTSDCTVTPPPSVKDASASVTVDPATCTTAGTAKFDVVNATWDDPTDTTDGSRTATADAGHLFSDGTSTATVTYTIPGKLDPTSPACVTSDATATVSVTPATCTAAGTATFDVTNATWDDPTDTTDGSRTATALPGHLFADGTSTATVTYTIPAQLDANALPCATEDATASAAATATPATCTAPGSGSFTITNATWDDPNDKTDGSRTATALPGHLFADGTTTATVTYAVNPQLDPHSAECKPDLTPTTVTTTDVQCDARDAEITTTTTTPTYSLVGSTWVRGADQVVTHTSMRNLTKAEITTCPTVVIDAPPGPNTTANVPPTTTTSTGQLAYTGINDDLPYVTLAAALAVLAGLGIIITGRVRARRH